MNIEPSDDIYDLKPEEDDGILRPNPEQWEYLETDNIYYKNGPKFVEE